jgi:hypothetical protein
MVLSGSQVPGVDEIGGGKDGGGEQENGRGDGGQDCFHGPFLYWKVEAQCSKLKAWWCRSGFLLPASSGSF